MPSFVEFGYPGSITSLGALNGFTHAPSTKWSRFTSLLDTGRLLRWIFRWRWRLPYNRRVVRPKLPIEPGVEDVWVPILAPSAKGAWRGQNASGDHVIDGSQRHGKPVGSFFAGYRGKWF
jgi:hypothetical protein